MKIILYLFCKISLLDEYNVSKVERNKDLNNAKKYAKIPNIKYI